MRQSESDEEDAPRCDGREFFLVPVSARAAVISLTAVFSAVLHITKPVTPIVSRMLGLPVSGCTINFSRGHHGRTWSTEDDDAGAESVSDLCQRAASLMPPLFDDRSGIANELLQVHHQVVSLVAGPLAEELFFEARLPGSEHDDEEAAAIGALIVRSASSLPAPFSCVAQCPLLAQELRYSGHRAMSVKCPYRK